MRRLAPWLALLLLASFAAPAFAQDDDEEPTGWRSSGFGQYLSAVDNRFLMGINSIVTGPADPVMSTVEPRKEFDELPLAIVTKWPIGFVQGTLLGAFRTTSGVLDLVFAPLTAMSMLSPEPRYQIFADAEHEYY